jgi:hypothetical protein
MRFLSQPRESFYVYLRVYNLPACSQQLPLLLRILIIGPTDLIVAFTQKPVVAWSHEITMISLANCGEITRFSLLSVPTQTPSRLRLLQANNYQTKLQAILNQTI